MDAASDDGPKKPKNKFILIVGEPKEGKTYYANYENRQLVAANRVEYGKVLYGLHRDGLEYLDENHTTETFSMAKLFRYIEFVEANKEEVMVDGQMKRDPNPPTLLYLSDCLTVIPWSTDFVKNWMGNFRHFGNLIVDTPNPGAKGGPTMRGCTDRVVVFRTGNDDCLHTLWENWFKQTAIKTYKEFEDLIWSLPSESHEFICWDKSQKDPQGRPGVWRGKAPQIAEHESLVWPNPRELDLRPLQYHGSQFDQLTDALPKGLRKEIHEHRQAPTAPRDVAADKRGMARALLSEGEESDAEEVPRRGLKRRHSFDEEEDRPIYKRRYLPKDEVDPDELANREPLLPPLNAAVLDEEAEVDTKIWQYMTGCRTELADFPFPTECHWRELPINDKRAMLYDMRCDVQLYGQRATHIAPMWNTVLGMIEQFSGRMGVPLTGYAQDLQVQSVSASLQEEAARTIRQLELENECLLPVNPWMRLISIAAIAAYPRFMAARRGGGTINGSRMPPIDRQKYQTAISRQADPSLAADLDAL